MGGEKARTIAADQIRAVATQLATADGDTANVTISMGYPTVTNNPRWCGGAPSVPPNTLGATQVLESALSMPAEDFTLSALALDALVNGVPPRGPVT